MASREGATVYHLPTRTAGYAYISGESIVVIETNASRTYCLAIDYLAAADLGRMFFQEPTDECLRQVIFDPTNVKQKAWVVFVNYMLLAMVSTEPDRSEEAKQLRLNAHLALDNASVFLSPSIVNVQTLATLAIHGEDFASPSQSWMLVGHACRQAEGLALHRPALADSDEQQRRLSLFWLLFLIDKGCSLAFGRSPSLSTTAYGNTPFPDYQYLARNCPHVSEVMDGRGQSQSSHFGAQFFIRGFELAKLIGSVLETNALAGSRPERSRLREQIEEWYRRSSTVRNLTHFTRITRRS